MKRRLFLLASCLVATAVVYMPVCDAVFDCGCTWPLLGDWQHCNVHVPGPPDCPICTGGASLQGAFFLGIAAPLYALAHGVAAALGRRARS